MDRDFLVTEQPTVRLGPAVVTAIGKEELIRNPPVDARLFLIDAADPAYAEEICFRLRQYPLPAVYLRMLVLISAQTQDLPPQLAGLADQLLGLDQLTDFTFQKLLDAAQPINQLIRSLPGIDQKPDTNIGLKLIRFLHTRNRLLKPSRSTRTIFGLSYPEAEIFLRRRDESIFQLLDFLEDQQLLSSTFFEKAHFCNQCGCAYLNFLEICPDCSSADLHPDDLIHHFRCAHVAPEAEFRQQTTLVCPKCEKELKQLGVDYDKPSMVYRCYSCRHTSQEPHVTTLCFHCGARALPENLDIRTIKEYRLTALAENAALYGMDSLFQRIIEQEIALVPFSTFKVFLQVEIERIKRYKLSTSCLILFQALDLDRIYVQLGQRAKDVFGEMAAIIKAMLRTSNIITSVNDSTFLSLLPETGEDGAHIALDRLKQRVAAIFTNNLPGQVTLQTHAVQLNPGQNSDALIEELLANAALERNG